MSEILPHDLSSASPSDGTEVPVKVNVPKKIIVLGCVILCALVASCFFMWKMVWQYNASPVSLLAQIKADYTDLNEQLALAVKGDSQNLAKIENHRAQMQLGIEKVNALDSELGERLTKNWVAIQSEIAFLTSQRTLIEKLPKMQQLVQKDSEAFSKVLSEFADTVAVDGTYTVETIKEINQLAINAQKVNAQLGSILLSFRPEIESIANLNNSLKLIEQELNLLLNGDPNNGVQSLKDSNDEEVVLEASNIFRSFQKNAGAILENLPEILALKSHLSDLGTVKDKLDYDLNSYISKFYLSDSTLYKNLKIIATALAATFFISIFVFFLIVATLKHKTTTLKFIAYTQKERNEKHEQAIMRLINEVGLLAKGDLSTVLSVTEDSTGIVADSVNLAIESIRQIVIDVRKNVGILSMSLLKLEDYQQSSNLLVERQKVFLKSIQNGTIEFKKIEDKTLQNIGLIDNRNSDINKLLQQDSLSLQCLGDVLPTFVTQINVSLETIKNLTKQVQDLKPVLVRYNKMQENLEMILQHRVIEPQNLHSIMLEQKQLNQYMQKFWSSLQSDMINIIAVITQFSQSSIEIKKHYSSLQDLLNIKQSKLSDLASLIHQLNQNVKEFTHNITNINQQIHNCDMNFKDWQYFYNSISMELKEQNQLNTELSSVTHVFVLPTDDDVISKLDLSLNQAKLKV